MKIELKLLNPIKFVLEKSIQIILSIVKFLNIIRFKLSPSLTRLLSKQKSQIKSNLLRVSDLLKGDCRNNYFISGVNGNIVIIKVH